MAELVEREMIRRELVPALELLLDETISAAGKAGCVLESAVLFGSVVGKSYIPGKSDVNMFMVFDKVSVELLKGLRPVFKAALKKLRTRPVVVDSEFLRNSTDVFPMEFLEWKERSSVIYGKHPLKEVEISQANLRLQIEENLRGKRLKLAQAYLGLERGGANLQRLLEKALPDFLTVLRNTLRLMGAAPNRDATGLIDAVEEKAGVSLTSFRRLQNIKTDGARIGERELELLFKGYLENLDALTTYIDSFKTK